MTQPAEIAISEHTLKPVVSPKELASAIGVSESSIKRWVDEGMIRAEKTSGGHRRISLEEVIRYTRDTQTRIVRPELLGLPHEAGTVDPVLTDADATELLHRHLMEGDAPQARGLILSLYLRGRSVAETCDLPLRRAMARIGAMFEHDDAGVFFEHRATEICQQALNRLRFIIEPDKRGPVAVGAALGGDTHALSTLAAATVMSGEGFHTVNLGADLPLKSLAKAVSVYQPTLAWVSISWVPEEQSVPEVIQALTDTLGPMGVQTVVGGHALEGLKLQSEPWMHILKSMTEFVDFARTLSVVPAE